MSKQGEVVFLPCQFCQRMERREAVARAALPLALSVRPNAAAKFHGSSRGSSAPYQTPIYRRKCFGGYVPEPEHLVLEYSSGKSPRQALFTSPGLPRASLNASFFADDSLWKIERNPLREPKRITYDK